MTDFRHTTDLAVLRFEGSDAARFLQGYLTCNTDLLGAQTWQPTALCNLQGRVVSSGFARGGATAIDLLVHGSLAAATLAFLAPYQRFSRTKSKALEGICVSASGSSAVPVQIDYQLEVSGEPILAADDAYWSLLNRLRQVVVTAQTSAEFLPQSLGLVDAGAIAFDKGCYLGQEIVARAEHRGNVKKNLVLGNTDKPLHARLMDDLLDNHNNRVGKVVQLAMQSALIVANRELEVLHPYRIGENPVTLTHGRADVITNNF